MEKRFSPLLFLASLGAGGIAIIPFAFFNYTVSHGLGLINISQMPYGEISLASTVLFRSMEAGMILFTALHLILSIIFFVGLVKFMKTQEYKKLLTDPLRNSSILAPFISITMTFNVVIGPVRYFITNFAENLQLFMIPALLGWSIIWLALMWTIISLLKTSFVSDFDVNKISFGWLLHPFALGMLTVTGTGIAALAKDPSVAHTAAFMSFISGTMGLFLLFVKVVAIFKSHFAATSLPEKQFLPSVLIVIPNITLYAISAFRIGHYLEHHHAAEMGSYFLLVMLTAFAFEVWYMMFGLSLLKDYFKRHFFKEFHITQWGLICPLVAFAVLGSFVYKVFVPSQVLYAAIIITTLLAAVAFLTLLYKQAKCAGIMRLGKTECN